MMKHRIVQILTTSGSTIIWFYMAYHSHAWSNYAMGVMGLFVLAAVVFIDQKKSYVLQKASADEHAPLSEQEKHDAQA